MSETIEDVVKRLRDRAEAMHPFVARLEST
jgi:hypothetical protein